MNNNISFENEAQIVDFINYAYRPKAEHYKDSLFKLKYVSGKEILDVVLSFTECFNKTTALGFSRWLKKQNIDFLNQEPERKVLNIQGSETEKLRTRILSVLDSQFHGQDNVLIFSLIAGVAHNILKKDSYEVIGYCRKSKNTTENRAVLLQRMINVLYQRSLVDKVFVSPCNSAKQALDKRDLTDVEVLSSLNIIHGNSQDFLSHIKKNKTKICVVAIDYAGFATNMQGLKNLIRENNNIEKIVIDLFFYENTFKVFGRD
ncbi:hypothetical protein CLU79DRAFT_859181 [Phycomyces nitens]|nr:hypothetical protein CLU79DRAFT_859181 [Phycomyces nitens]